MRSICKNSHIIASIFSDEADDAANTGPSTGTTTTSSSRLRSNRDKKVLAGSAHYTCVWYICAAKMHYAHYMLTQSFIRKLSSRTCSMLLLARMQVFLSSGLGSLDVSLDELNFCLEWDEKSPVWVSNACFVWCVRCVRCVLDILGLRVCIQHNKRENTVCSLSVLFLDYISITPHHICMLYIDNTIYQPYFPPTTHITTGAGRGAFCSGPQRVKQRAHQYYY